MNFLARTLPVLAFVSVVSLGSNAMADAPPDDDAFAATLKEQGNADMNALRYDSALEKFNEALARAKDPTLRASLIYNKGRTYQAIGNYPRALDELETFDKTAPPELKAKVAGFDTLLDELRDRVSLLSISCSVVGAEIRIGERIVDVCRAGSNELRLNAGRTHLEVRKEGYAPFLVDLDLPGRKTLAVQATLVANEVNGALRIESVAGTVVRVDGKDLGPVPVEVSVAPGNHIVVLSKSGFEPTKKSVLVARGQKYLVKVDDLAATPFTKTPGFWGLVGGGVALVGAAVVGFVVAANTEKPPGTGSIAPGRVYTGGVRF